MTIMVDVLVFVVAILVRIPWKITKIASQYSKLGHYGPPSKPRQRNAIAIFKRYLDPLQAGRWWSTIYGIWILSSFIDLKHVVSWVGPPSDNTFWIRAWCVLYHHEQPCYAGPSSDYSAECARIRRPVAYAVRTKIPWAGFNLVKVFWRVLVKRRKHMLLIASLCVAFGQKQWKNWIV